MKNCEHKFIHLETKKQAAERGSIGMFPSKDWVRIDIFFCEKCLEQKIIKQTADWLLMQPEWW